MGIRSKLILAFLALALLLSSAAGALSYYLTYRENVEQYSEQARSAGRLAASEIDAASVERYLENGRDESYDAAERELINIKKNLDVRFLYAFVPSLTEMDAITVFDVASGAEDAGMTLALGEHMGTDEVLSVTQKVLETGREAESGEITRGEYGYLLSAYVPVLDENGKAHAVLGVDIDMDNVMHQIKTQTAQVAGATAIVILVFLALFLIFIDRRMVKPIQALSEDMSSFDKNAAELSIRRSEVRTGDEIEAMSDSFNKMAEDIKQYVENLRRVTAEKERIAAELGVAKQIQASMLPSIFTFIPKRDEFSIFATMEPAKEVGGDFYDFYIVDGKYLVFVVADVSGKGVPAALFMVIAKTLIKNHALQGEAPAEILTKVNNQLCENNDAGMFVTVFLGMIELATGNMTYANAGHNQPLLRHDGKYTWFREKPNFVLAGMEGIVYKNRELKLEAGDRLYVYTDGVTEALNPAKELFSDPRLEDCLNKAEEEKPDVHALLAAIREDIRVFADGAEQADDITMMSVDWFGDTRQASQE